MNKVSYEVKITYFPQAQGTKHFKPKALRYYPCVAWDTSVVLEDMEALMVPCLKNVTTALVTGPDLQLSCPHHFQQAIGCLCSGLFNGLTC